MSLINDALKKAQSRESTPAPSSGGGGMQRGTPLPPPPPPKGPNIWMVVSVLLFTLILFLAGVGLVLWGVFGEQDTKETASSAQTAIPSEPTQESIENTVEPDHPSIKFSVEEETKTPVPTAPQPAKDQEPKVIQPKVAQTPNVVQKTSGNEPKTETISRPQKMDPAKPTGAKFLSQLVSPPKEKTPAPAPSPDPQIQAYLLKLEVRGVMSSGKKVLLFDPDSGNSYAYTEGDRLKTSLNLTLTRVADRTLYIKDDGGLTYLKRF